MELYKYVIVGILVLGSSVFAQNVHDAKKVDLKSFVLEGDFEIVEWATSPMLYNPTNMDIDYKGRVWVAEGRNYRRRKGDPKGDRIVVLEDTNGDGKADKSHTFVQDPELISPLGVAVVGNKVIVSQPPHLIIYTDVNNDAKFDPKVDKRENFLTGFEGKNHDHSLHSLTVGPNGQYYFNVGNAGVFKKLEDKEGNFLSSGSFYKGRDWAGQKSSDGFVYVGGMAMRINPDGTGLD